MARKISTKAALASSTSLVTVPKTIEGEVVGNSVAQTTPTIGDNLPTETAWSTVHDNLASVMTEWLSLDVRADNARQRMAFYIMQRHAIQVRNNDQTPRLDVMATLPTNNPVFGDYLKELVTELAGPHISDKDAKTAADLDAQEYRGRVNTRMTRALQLACWIAWLKCDVSAFDTERTHPVSHDPMPAAWRLPPRAFVPHGYACEMLMFITEGENITPRPFVYLESDTKSVSYFARRGNTAATRITLSLSQLEHAVTSQIAAAKDTSVVADGATAGDAKRNRAARQPTGNVSSAPNTDQNGNLAPSGKADRNFYIATLRANLVAIGKVLAVDTLGAVTFKELDGDAWNALVDLVQLYDRIQESDLQGKDNGVPNKSRGGRKVA